MPDTPPPPIPGYEPAEAPTAPVGGAAAQLAAAVSSRGFGVNPDQPEGSPTVSHSGLRLGLLAALLVWLAVANPWLLVVIMGLVVMIGLHEFGHYYMAKRAGMQVTEFFLGFGPKLWSTRRGETEYGIKLIPAGAYVKIPGMVNIDEVDPANEARTYRQKSFAQRVGVAVAGSTMHFLLAIVSLYVALVVVGQPGASITSTADVTVPAVIERVSPGSGADAANLLPGDRITSVGGVPTETSDDLRGAVAQVRGDKDVPVEIERGGATTVVPVDIKAYRTDGVGYCGIGIVMAAPPNDRVGPVKGLVQAPKEFAEIMWVSAKGLGSFFSPGGISDFAGQVGSAQEDRQAKSTQDEDKDEDPCAVPATTSASSASGGSSSGENRILSIVGLVRYGSGVGSSDPASLISLFALVNIFIGMFNLVPLLPFDGGHVAIAVYEKIQERRLHQRRYFADVSRLLPLTYVVIVVLFMMFVSSLYLDVVNPIG